MTDEMETTDKCSPMSDETNVKSRQEETEKEENEENDKEEEETDEAKEETKQTKDDAKDDEEKENNQDDNEDKDDDEENEMKDEENEKPKISTVKNLYATKKSTSQEEQKKEEEPKTLFTPELLSVYYSRLFPSQLMFDWLNYNPSSSNNNDVKLFARREFSFTLAMAQDEVYLRYQSFASANELERALRQKVPVKMDLGAIYNQPPRNSAKSQLIPVQRELVIDVDLTDYDDVRHCGCTGASICRVCWVWMKWAVHVLQTALLEDFGFQHVAWFYSGRRGVHAWVCDEAARQLDDAGRSAVANYLQIALASEKNRDASYLTMPLHPMVKRAHKFLEPEFIQHILPSLDWQKDLLDTLPSAAQPVGTRLAQKWNEDEEDDEDDAEQKWTELTRHLHIFAHRRAGPKQAKILSSRETLRLDTWPIETVLKFTYPRLDINVSKMRNHLLKSPYCVHPKTGRVCVYIDDIDTFCPFRVPTLVELVNELNQTNAAETKKQWQKTSLRSSLEHFENDFMKPLHQALRRQQRQQAQEEAAVWGDF